VEATFLSNYKCESFLPEHLGLASTRFVRSVEEDFGRRLEPRRAFHFTVVAQPSAKNGGLTDPKNFEMM